MYLPEGAPHHVPEDDFDLRGSLRRFVDACRTYRLAMAATVLFTVGLVQAYLMLWPPIYRAEILIVADSPKDVGRSGFYEVWNVFRTEELATAAELITSRSVLVKWSRPRPHVHDVYHPFLTHALL